MRPTCSVALLEGGAVVSIRVDGVHGARAAKGQARTQAQARALDPAKPRHGHDFDAEISLKPPLQSLPIHTIDAQFTTLSEPIRWA